MKKAPNKTRAGPSRLAVILILAALMLVSFLLGTYVFAKTSLRLDEAQSLYQTDRDIPGIIRFVATDVHVPLYHILLHFWQKIFGSGIEAARSMSLLFLLLVIPATYALARYAVGRKAAIYAALLVTISPFMVWYGSEARMYTMLALITIINQLYFLKVQREGKSRHWLVYGITSVLGLYTHYFFAFVLLTEAMYFFWKYKQFTGRRVLLKFMAVGGIVVVAFSPWLLYMKSRGGTGNMQPHLMVPSSGDLFNTYAQFVFGFQMDYVNTVIVSFWPLLILLAFFALQRKHVIPRDVPFLVTAAVLPVAAAFIISVTLRPFFLSRYLVVALPALFVFIAWALNDYPPRLSRGLKTGLALAIVIMLAIEILSPNTPVKEDYSAAVSYLNRQTTDQDVIIASAPFTIYPIEYYYEGRAKLTTEPVWDRFDQGAIPAFDRKKLDSDTKALKKSYRQAWVILSYDQGYNKQIKDYFQGNYEQLSVKQFSPGLTVYSFKLRYDDPLLITPVTAPVTSPVRY